MSENKKMSSPYSVLGDRPIDQWKVTELKEELKRRNLMSKGLKEDLVIRLDEAVLNENEDDQMNVIASFDSVSQPEVQAENSVTSPAVAETTGDIIFNGENISDRLDINNDTVDCGNIKNMRQKVDIDMPQADINGALGSLVTESVGEVVVEEISVETTAMVSESMVSEIAFSGKDLQNGESDIKCGVSNSVHDTLDSNPPHEEAKANSSDVNVQVAEVNQVISDSISIDTISVTVNNELKDSVVADYVKLEVDVKPEQPSSMNTVPDGGSLQSIDIDEPFADKITAGAKNVIKDENADTLTKSGCRDVGSPEKLYLDRSSGDDSMEEDVLETKQVDSKLGSDDIGDKSEKIEVSVVKEDNPLDAMIEDKAVGIKAVNAENQNGLAADSVKRKLHEQEAGGNTDLVKQQRRWNSESLKVPEPQGGNISASNTPKDAIQPTKTRNFSRSNSAVGDEAPKERVVPPSPKTPTNSLRIDRFLRPFTLKAVQELLGKTGSITSFWMDHIKTHCYVTYSSIEEAVETRNAVCNLQWPTNGGHLLMAEFVDPQEVKNRVEVPTLPLPSQAPMQPSPRLKVQRQQLPPQPPLPPPPSPPPARERLLPPPPPPPPLPEKVDPHIVTLDDLFRKTKATPRIYYLPLSEDEVAAKLKPQGKNL